MRWLLNQDIAWRAWVAAHQYAWLDRVMVLLSEVGRGGLIWIVLALLMAWRRRPLRAGACQIILAVLLSWGLTDGLMKPLVHRPRPFHALTGVRLLDHRSSTASFPSGHAATSSAGALVFSAVWPAARVAAWALAGLIAYSRIYVGAHYPFDVLAGVLVGAACGWFVLGGRLGWRLARIEPRNARARRAAVPGKIIAAMFAPGR